MKPYLFLSGLLLGTGISMSSLMADTRVLDASCNDARYGACTSAQTSLTTDEIMLAVENKEDYHTNDFSICDINIHDATPAAILGFSPPNERSMLEEALLIPVEIVLRPVATLALYPVLAGAWYCFFQNDSYVSYDSVNLWKTKKDSSLVEDYHDKLIQLRLGDSDYPLYE